LIIYRDSKKLYGNSFDESSIRHANSKQSEIGLAEAKYMLVICSAFVYFVIQKIDVDG